MSPQAGIDSDGKGHDAILTAINDIDSGSSGVLELEKTPRIDQQAGKAGFRRQGRL
jgi:hypothetical protein